MLLFSYVNLITFWLYCKR